MDRTRVELLAPFHIRDLYRDAAVARRAAAIARRPPALGFLVPALGRALVRAGRRLEQLDPARSDAPVPTTTSPWPY